jgi:MinD superfamily P-loop ATPase
LHANISVASGKGGTGKTTIATNLAAVLAEQGERVVYADCDVEEPNGHLFLRPEPEMDIDISVMTPVVTDSSCNRCGICAEVCQFNALAVLGDKFLLFPSLCHSCGACVTLCPEQAMHEEGRKIGHIRTGPVRGLNLVGGVLSIGEAQAPPMIKAVKGRLPDDALVIIDSPPGTSCPVVETVRESDYVILVTEPTPFGLNDLRLAVGMLRQLALPFGVVINRSDIGDSLVRNYCSHENIPILIELPFDRDVAETSASGKLPIDEHEAFRERIRELCELVKREVTHVRASVSQW